MLSFLFAASHDPRFSVLTLLPEINAHFPLSIGENVTYAFLIPGLRAALHIAEKQLAWTEDRTPWGPGRDDAFNLPKFILTKTPLDDSVSNTKFATLWGLAPRRGTLFHAGGEASTVSSIIATSALGAGGVPGETFEDNRAWIEEFLGSLTPPAFPKPIDAALASTGREIYAAHCRDCHEMGGSRTGTTIPLDEIGTDPQHVLAWKKANADRMNTVVAALGVPNAKLQAASGYVAKPLVGLWLGGPYLHNGSVPNLSDLLTPPAGRPTVFFTGGDVIDSDNVGFKSSGSTAEATGYRYDTALKGNGNAGHIYGTDLPQDQKRALLEYLKSL
jgi:hypothetical protein